MPVSPQKAFNSLLPQSACFTFFSAVNKNKINLTQTIFTFSNFLGLIHISAKYARFLHWRLPVSSHCSFTSHLDCLLELEPTVPLFPLFHASTLSQCLVLIQLCSQGGCWACLCCLRRKLQQQSAPGVTSGSVPETTAPNPQELAHCLELNEN